MAKERLLSVTASDCDFQYFTAGGKGGQNQNKVASACRVVHRPSGAVGESREHRHQLENKRAAWKRMAGSEKMQAWLRVESARALGMEDKINRAVENAMRDSNLRVDVKDANGRWVTEGTFNTADAN